MTGREAKLQELETLYRQSGNQIVVLYGRRDNQGRELVREFCKDKKSFYYCAPEVSAKAQRARMGREIAEYYQVSLSEDSYDTCFKRIKSGDGSKLALVIDEFQYILKKDSEFLTSVIKLRDKKLYPGPILILLCSSDISWVEQELPPILGKMQKKVAKVIKLCELPFAFLAKNFPDYSLQQKVETYGIIGGVPEYIHQWDKRGDTKHNVCTLILSAEGYFHNRAQELIRSQLRELTVYNTILEAMASGKRKLNELYQETGFSRAKISVYLKNLMEFDVVEKVSSFETGGWENAQKGLYQIKDTFLNFWYKFVYPHLSDLYRMDEEAFYEKYIAKELDSYLERYFVMICMEYLTVWNQEKKLPLELHKMGTWIGKKGKIDIIAQDSIRQNLICLCNWKEPEMTFDMCLQLFASMEQAKVTASFYYLFTAKGFEEKLVKMVAKEQRILLVDMNQQI